MKQEHERKCASRLDLISLSWEEKIRTEGPLARRMRPAALSEFAGQDSILGAGKPLRRLIEGDSLVSMIFFGPPGTGKTTLAWIIAAQSSSAFVQLNAVATGVKELRDTIKEAAERWAGFGKRTILFIDEIHRFSKVQQDALLEAVEQGTVIFIGATTENPFFHLTGPLLSRARLFVFEPLSSGAILTLRERALNDAERGLGKLAIEAEPEALRYLADRANGDARTALNALEFAATAGRKEGKITATLADAREALQYRALPYDRDGDNHYDLASALIKSIRGSDPDAALYWMARMLKGGEDPLFIARRLMFSAADDIGNADPRALQVAVAAAEAVRMVGLPEGRIILAQAVTYLAGAPKSNASYLGIEAASAAVEEEYNRPVPAHLRGSNYPGAARLGHGRGYRYPHDYPGHYVRQDYLPPALRGRIFYQPTEQGFEKQIKARLDRLRGAKGRPGSGEDGDG